MIKIKKIAVKNFLSYGNAVTTVELDKNQSTLIVAKNGSGKTAIIVDALCFALFGKAFRKINKPALVNSINQRDCLVELDFEIGLDQYKIKRGIKPEKFEIYKAGKLIEQEAASRDYQGYLEKSILQVNFKTFSQILILSSANFTPFMQLSAGARREIIEDILDIGIFTKMNRLLKEKITVNKDQLTTIDIKIDSAKRETITQKKLISVLETNKQSAVKEIQDEIYSVMTEMDSTKSILDELTSKQIVLKNRINCFDYKNYSSLIQIIEENTGSIKTIKAKAEKFGKLKDCPMCKQTVGHSHSEFVKNEFLKDIATFEESTAECQEQLDILDGAYKLYLSDTEELRLLELDIQEYNRIKRDQENNLGKLRVKLTDQLQKTTGNLDSEKDKLREIAATALSYIETKAELINERSIHEVVIGLLKDTGIKSAIVKEYLPILNKLINKYLQMFDFFVNFELDENFNETIKSRGRDDFAYSSFSEGEKKRIDIAILMAFRQIAEMKNSSRINILVCDEIDSGMDQASTEKFVEIVTNMQDCSVWVISHVLSGTSMADEFEARAEVKKVGDFSQFEVL